MEFRTPVKCPEGMQFRECNAKSSRESYVNERKCCDCRSNHPLPGRFALRQIRRGASIQRLMKGNQRFVTNHPSTKDISIQKRKDLIQEQQPFAVILACSDSRVPPELIFDQGLGDIFVVRTAGNTVDKITLGSIEYGLEHLHAPRLVILGHQDCGAVKATIESAAKAYKEGRHARDSIGEIVNKIMPAVEKAKTSGKSESDLLDASIQENVKNVYKEILEKSPVLKKLSAKKKINVVLAEYYLDSGMVKIIEK